MNNDLKKIQKQFQSEFDHKYACWAINHGGWRKAKKRNHKTALAKVRRSAHKEIYESENIREEE